MKNYKIEICSKCRKNSYFVIKTLYDNDLKRIEETANSIIINRNSRIKTAAILHSKTKNHEWKFEKETVYKHGKITEITRIIDSKESPF